MCDLHEIHGHIQLPSGRTSLWWERQGVCLHCSSPEAALGWSQFPAVGVCGPQEHPVAPPARHLWRCRLCCRGCLVQETCRHQSLSPFLCGNLGKNWNISEGILPDIHVSTFSAHSRGAVVTNILKVFKCWQIQFSFEGCQQFCGSKSHLQSKGESLALTFEKWRLLWIYEKGSLKCFLSNCCWGAWGISKVPRLRKAGSGGADGFLSSCCM